MNRIVYFSKGGQIDGSHRQLCYLVTNLRHAYEPTVICTGDGPIVARLRAVGVPAEVIRLRPWRKLPSGLLRYGDAERLVALIRWYDPALIHCSDMWLGNYLAWLRRRLRVPTIVHVRAPLGLRGIWKHRLYTASGLISISKRITETLTRAPLCAGKVVQIEDGVDIEYFQLRTREDSRRAGPGAEEEIVKIGIVGRIEPAKRQLEFLAAAARVLAELPGRVRFFVIGAVRDERYFARLKQAAAMSRLDGQLVFTGRREDMPEVLNSLDVLVSLSGGSVMYEAMSCGVCVLSAGFTRPDDSVHVRDGVTGIVVPTGETSAVAGAIRHLVQHPELRRSIGQAARRHAEAELSHVAMAARTVRFYDDLLSGTSDRQ